MRGAALKDKVAIVTGAGRGIGAAVARRFADCGARLVLTGLHLDTLQALDLGPAGAAALRMKHDVGDPGEWQEVVARTLAQHGRIDVLVNNAGVVVPGAADAISRAEIERQVSSNFLGVVHGCRAVLPAMRAQGSGKIVNVASLGAIMPMPFEAVYCATKHAVRGYSLALEAELRGTGIGVCVFCPDSVETRQLEQELACDGAALSFFDPPLSAERVARGITRAVVSRKPEILMPAGTGVLTRLAMAFPRLVLWLMPVLRRMGARRMARRRRERDAV